MLSLLTQHLWGAGPRISPFPWTMQSQMVKRKYEVREQATVRKLTSYRGVLDSHTHH